MQEKTKYVVYYGNENVGYHYKYAEPIGDTTYQPRYHWEFIEWGECSVRCGGGTEVAEPECVEAKGGKVSSTFCKEIEKPPIKTRKCNEQPCKTKWRIGKWSLCSACKFQSGVRMREVECVREAQKPGNEDVLVDDEKCPPPKPGTRELCNSHRKCAKTKREDNGISANVLKHLWFQTRNEYMLQEPLSLREISNPRNLRKARRSIIKSRRNLDNVTKYKGNANATLKVGTIVDDKIPPEQIKLIEVPLKQSHLSLNLTDVAFETMGDKIPDSIDSTKEKVFTGKEAAKRMKEIQHKNQTDTPDKKK